jgi:hypothetical protein
MNRSSYRELMKLDYPDAQHGRWRIERIVIDEHAARMATLRAMIHGGRGAIQASTFVGLYRTGTLVMSDTPDEMRDHSGAYFAARARGGRVLIHGLGLGMLLKAVLALENVDHVDVVEIDEDVIALVGPHLHEHELAGRLTIHHGDALTYKWPVGTRWTVAWHDIWDTICEDNLPDMNRLHRRFGRRVDWQGSWCRDLIETERRRWA